MPLSDGIKNTLWAYKQGRLLFLLNEVFKDVLQHFGNVFIYAVSCQAGWKINKCENALSLIFFLGFVHLGVNLYF